MALSASASGLAFGANWPIAYSAAAATKIAEMTVVSKNARTLLRGGRLPAARLRCCDNAVLPWAERARRAAVRTGPLRAKAASHVPGLAGASARHLPGRTAETRSQLRCRTTLPEVTEPTKRFRRKSWGVARGNCVGEITNWRTVS